MKRTLGLLLMFAGLGVILWGVYLALSPLAGLYQGAIDDPLGQPEGTEKKAASDAFRNWDASAE